MNAKTMIASALAAAFLTLATTANAATLFTPPLSFQVWFGTVVVCKITNVADGQTKVRVRAYHRNGAVDADSGAVLLQPRETIEVEGVGAGRNYCRFDVVGSAHRVRASACNIDTFDDSCRGVVEAY